MFTPFVLRWIASSLLCALVVTEHLRLAFRLKNRWAWLVPFAPLALVVRRGERAAAAPSILAMIAWLALRATG